MNLESISIEMIPSSLESIMKKKGRELKIESIEDKVF